MGPIRRVRIFRNGNSQATSIPREFELDAGEATIRQEGKCLVIEPIERFSLLELLSSWRPLEMRVPDIPDAPPELVEL